MRKGLSEIAKKLEQEQMNSLPMINLKYLRQHANQIVHINKDKVFFLHKKNLAFPKFIHTVP